jgi:hypothetical protein
MDAPENSEGFRITWYSRVASWQSISREECAVVTASSLLVGHGSDAIRSFDRHGLSAALALDDAHPGVGIVRLGPDTRADDRLNAASYDWRARLELIAR